MVAAWMAEYLRDHNATIEDKLVMFETYERQPAYETQAQRLYRNLGGIIRTPETKTA
jgi:hypothetical protein